MSDHVKIFVVGNKIDTLRREVKFEEAQDLCIQYDAFYFECSAKYDDNPLKITKLIAQKCKASKDLKAGLSSTWKTLLNFLPIIIFLICILFSTIW